MKHFILCVATMVTLTLLFIVLQLTGAVCWSWWWVFSPLWIPFGLSFVLAAIIVAVLCCTKVPEDPYRDEWPY